MKSSRSDKRGHWPAGKRRNDPGDKWPAVKRRLVARLDRPVYGKVSIRSLADWCGISDKTIRRWLAGRCVPDSAGVDRIAAWLDDVRGARS